MLPIVGSTQTFASDQRTTFTVEYWDSPFAVLEGTDGSGGIIAHLRNPTGSGAWTLPAQLRAAATNTSALSTFTNTAYSSPNLVQTDGVTPTDGRVDNLIRYWSAGAPGYHGATVNKRVAYHFRGHLRDNNHGGNNAHAWFSGSSFPTFFLAVAGQGFVRIDKTVGSTVTTVFRGTVSETDYLAQGFKFTSTTDQDGQRATTFLTISDMGPGDYLDIYYVQDTSDEWGGFVFKVVSGDATTMTEAQRQAAAAAAPVLSCDLFDDNAFPVRRVLTGVASVQVERGIGKPASASFELPLLNTQTDDGLGWEWYRGGGASDSGLLRQWSGGQSPDFTMKRQRLVRISGGFLSENVTVSPSTFASEVQTLFVGFIDDFESASDGVVTVTCKAFEQRLLDQFDKNYPDKISYMSRGYKLPATNVAAADPIYDLPCYDAWPLEYAVTDLLIRAGIAPSRLTKALQVSGSGGTPTTVVYGGATYQKVRARTLQGKQLLLERPLRYGNAGFAFVDGKQTDDPYIFKSDASREIWARIREMTERYGYDCWFDEAGDLWLQPRATPHYVYDLTTSDLSGGVKSQQVHPSAFAGTYLSTDGNANIIDKVMTGARIDLVSGRQYGAKGWSYSVVRVSDNATVASGTVFPSAGMAASDPEQFFYDFRTAVDGTNACVATLFSGAYDTYKVSMFGSGGGTGQRLDAFFVYHTDAAKPLLPSALSTTTNALSVTAKSTMDDLRNAITVVGRRVATVTDSDKFKDNNPDNPAAEFIVSAAVDAASVLDPTATNYIGYAKESVIVDNNITDLDFADYLARTFIYRQRLPRPSASIEHTLLPVLQLRDPVYAVEDRFQSITAATILYVTGIRHRFLKDRATTEIETTSYQEFPSYEPRADLDTSASYNNYPVSNVSISYTSLTGELKVNPGPGLEHLSLDMLASGGTVSGDICEYLSIPVTTSGGVSYLDLNSIQAHWPPVPGTVFIRPGANTPANAGTTTVLEFVLPVEGASPQFVLPAFRSLTAVQLKRTYTDVTGTHSTLEAWSNYKISTPGSYAISATGYLLASPPSTLVSTSLVVTYVTVPLNVYGELTQSWLTNTPYHHFLDVDYRVTAGQENFVLWSEVYDQGVWSKDGSADEDLVGVLAPDGSTNAKRINFPSGSVQSIWQACTANFTGTRTASVWLRADTPFSLRLGGKLFSTNSDVVINLTTAWQRFEVPNTFANETSHFTLRRTATDTTARQFYMWGAQVNSGATATAYTPTTTAQISTGTPSGRRIYLPFKQADDTAAYQRNTAITNWDVRYRRLGPVDSTGIFADPYPSGSPFYDPYTSELGSLVKITFNALKSAAYRIAIKSVYDDTTVAYLTSPSVDPTDPEAHYQFLTAGANKTFYWDGVDQVGSWNQRQSKLYAESTAGAFEKPELSIGRGFYVWNQEANGGNFPDLALIASSRDVVTNAPVFGQGTFAKWYLSFEAKENGQSSPTLVTTKGQRTAADNTASIPEAYVYTHLPEPTKVAMTPSDWKGSGTVDVPSDYTDGQSYSGTDWSSTPSVDAHFNNYKPVRVRFAVQPRPGIAWSGKAETATFRLTRHVHVKVLINDQYVHFAGTSYPVSGAPEQRTIVSRRMHTDDSEKLTYTFTDDGYRKASTLKTDTRDGVEWIFQPKLLKNNWTGVDNQPIDFANYLQIEEVPGWMGINKPAGERSRLQIAFMAYLFYLSAYTQDRSGRLVWCLNPAFIDRAKILNNASADWGVPASEAALTGARLTSYTLPWPDDLTTMQRRTVITRQWADEGPTGNKWKAQQKTKWGFGTGSLGEALLEHKWHSHSMASTKIYGRNNAEALWTSFSGLALDNYTNFHALVAPGGSRDTPAMPATYLNLNRQLGTYTASSQTSTTALGSWTWDTAPTPWVPCVTRDFHGFYLVPHTADTDEAIPTNSVGGHNYYRFYQCYEHVDNKNWQIRDNSGDDAGAFTAWSSPCDDMNQTNGTYQRFWPGRSVQKDHAPIGSSISPIMGDYIRQENGLVHYEELRNAYSRKQRPEEAPLVANAPPNAYYINTYQYDWLSNYSSRNNGSIPLARAHVADWFRVTFRHEYLWESATMFPASLYGVEKLIGYNANKTRFLSKGDINRTVSYDPGAWTGWKDDRLTSTGGVPTSGNAAFALTSTNLYLGNLQPISVGPRLDVTRDILFHLTLVNERRASPIPGV